MGDAFLVPPGTQNTLPLPKDNLAPRIGLAYSMTPKTIVRSGYGIFWVPNYVSFALNPTNDMVNAASTTYTGTVDGTHPYNSISLPFPDGISPPPGRTLGTEGTQQFLTQVVQSITEVNRAHHPNGYVQQWNLSVERELPPASCFRLLTSAPRELISSNIPSKSTRSRIPCWLKLLHSLKSEEGLPSRSCSLRPIRSL